MRSRGLQALRGLPLNLGGEIVYAHNSLLDKLAKETWEPEDRPWKVRLYGGKTPDAKMVGWIYQSQATIAELPVLGAA